MKSYASRSSFLVLTSCLAALTVGACSIPNALPRGYVYHDKEFKSPNPPESSKFTSLQRTTMGPEQADQFRMAVYTLVDNLTNRAGMPPKSIYVVTPEPMTPFYANFDNDLRESLRHVGYRLTDTPEGAYAMTYKAEQLKKEAATEGDTSPNMRITLFVHDMVGEDGKVLTQETGDFYIKGGEALNVPFANFPGTFVPEPTGPGGNYRE